MNELLKNTWIDSNELFLATLHTLETPEGIQAGRALYLSHAQDGNGKLLDGHSDWLIAGHEKPAYPLRFLLHSRSADRLHYMITGSGPDHDKKLGVSRNGYVGLYRHASVDDYLKVEPLAWEGDALVCRLRDHLGHEFKASHDVAAERIRFSYMNVTQGMPLRFLIRRA
ncbi:hypothetical protein [Pseudomonas xanthosomatis]|uniref:hypothetical protein n=1 Tax=Pseudomonas xanthosomatis TaxID=2842356 RepID=UPI003517F77E